MWRSATAEEDHVLALAVIDDGLKRFESAYAARLLEFKRASAEFIGQSIADGLISDASQIAGADAFSTFPGRDQAKGDLLRILGDIADFGRGQVEDELARQK